MHPIEKMKQRGIIPRAAVYARFSSDNQRDESIDAQLRAIKAYCADREVVIVEEFIDRAKSATTDDRPEFKRMIEESAKNRFNLVIVHKLDRFARNRNDSTGYRNKLNRNGVALVSVLENLDDSPESVIMESVLEGMAEYYSKNLAREVRKGMTENALKCQANGGRAPFGFKVNRDTMKYEIVEEEAVAVRFVFDAISKGNSYEFVITELNRMGFKTRNGNSFSKNSIHDMLVNEKYRGVYIYNRRPSKDYLGRCNSHANKYPDEIIRIEGGMPRIVSDEVFGQVNKIITRRSDLRPHTVKRHTYLLTGKIFCGECGCAFCGNTRKSGKKNKTEYSSYDCCTKHNKTYATCKNHEIRRDVIENFVIKEILRVVVDDERIPELAEKYRVYFNERLNSSDTEVQALKSNISECEVKIKNLVSVISKSGSPSLLSALEAEEQEKARLEAELEDIVSRFNSDIVSEKEIKEAYKLAKQQFFDGSADAKKQLINLYLDKVVVYSDYVEVYVHTLPRYILERMLRKKSALEKKITHSLYEIVSENGRGDRI